MKKTLILLMLAAATGTVACNEDSSDESAAEAPAKSATVLTVKDTSTPGNWSFDKESLTAKAGRVTIQLQNDSGLGHNVRIHTGKCCFKPGHKDLGGTEVIGATSSDKRTTTHATLDLEPGTYTFLCSIPGHFQAGQHGTLVVD